MIENSYILLDTCFVNNLLSKEEFLVSQTKSLIDQFLKNKNVLCVSEFTKYELLRDASITKKLECENILRGFHIIPHNDERLNRATNLYESYKHEPSVNNILHSISDVDIFIGSLIFNEQKPYLLTADFADFPRPFSLRGIFFQLNSEGHAAI